MPEQNQRWAFPGLHYFEDRAFDRALFFGRDTEIKQLTERIIAEDLTVLFGKSGDGKTSLINAGLKPKLRELGYLPVRARLFNLPKEKTPIDALYQAITDEAQENQVALPISWQHKTLWETFFALQPTTENGLKPVVLILDQFEELFTLMAGRPQAQEDFIAQLADLARGRLPEPVRENYRAQLSGLPPGSEEARKFEQLLFGAAAPTVRLVLSLREDYLAFLNNLGKRIPKVFASRFRLSSLSIAQAREAIANPPQQEVLADQKFRIDEDAITAVLKFLTVQSSSSGVSEETVGPPQLQVLLSQLEKQMRDQGRDRITVADLGGEKGMRQLLSRYYRGILAQFPRMRVGPGPKRLSGLGFVRRLLPVHSPRFAVRCLCEERLITAGGNRNSRHEDEIIREIGVVKEDLEKLVDSRLVRREPRLQESFYELSHDSLVPSLQAAGGLRKAWMTSLKFAAIAVVIFVAINWGWPYVTGIFEINRLQTEMEAVKSGQASAEYFRVRLRQAQFTAKIDSMRLADIHDEFDGWRKKSLQDAFFQADLARADTLLKMFRDEYPRAEETLSTLSDTLRERKIRWVAQRYFDIVLLSSAATPDEETFTKANNLLDSAYTVFQGNISITELQKDLAKRRGAFDEVAKLNREIEVKKEVARKELSGAIQIREPQSMIVKGDSTGDESQFEIVLQPNAILQSASVMLNDREMYFKSILGRERFRAGMITIPAGADQVTVRIKVISKEGIENVQAFTFTADRQPPRLRTKKILYRDNEKESWKDMPEGEWRGKFWRIEVKTSESLQNASAKISLVYDLIMMPPFISKELSFVGVLSSDKREVAFEDRSDEFKIARSINFDIELQDLVGWQSTINLGEWQGAKAQETQVAQQIEKTSQPVVLRLRSTPDENLTTEEVRNMLKKYDFYCRGGLPWSNPEGKGIANDFVLQREGKVVLDRATGLMWQQSASWGGMSFENAHRYVDELNRRGLAGFSNWRLPTLDEAMSLMETAKQGDLFIDEKFDPTKTWIWTSDRFNTNTVWVASFGNGGCDFSNVTSQSYFRAVRSGQ